MNKGEEMMEQKLNECYERIYEQCKKTLPIEWTEVRIWAERNEEEYQAPAGEYWDYDSLTVYKDTQGKWHRTPDIDKEFSKEADFFYVRNSPTKIVEDIYRIFEEAGMERFKVFNYTVDAEGHFQVNFQYEYTQGDSFIERVTLWEYEQTGYTGTNSSKEIVKKYHPEFEG